MSPSFLLVTHYLNGLSVLPVFFRVRQLMMIDDVIAELDLDGMSE